MSPAPQAIGRASDIISFKFSILNFGEANNFYYSATKYQKEQKALVLSANAFCFSRSHNQIFYNLSILQDVHRRKLCCNRACHLP
jgi:hypothetical protein